MAFHTVEDGPWPYGTTVAVWPTSAVSGGVPSGPPLDTVVANPSGTATFGGLTEGVSYTAFGHGGSQTFEAVNQEALGARVSSVESSTDALATVYAAEPTGVGATDTAAVQAAIDALPSSGGIVQLARGSYVCSGQLSFNSKSGVILRGHTSAQADTGEGTSLIYTGTSSTHFISARDVDGLTIEHVNVIYNNNGFTGHLIDARGNTVDSAKMVFRNCFFGSQPTSLTNAASLVRLLKTHTVSFENCTFFGATNAAWGQESGSGNNANAVSFRSCLFQNGFSDFTIRNPGSSWVFEGCAFQQAGPGASVGQARAIYTEDIAIFSTGLAIVGCWFGDDTANGGDWIRVRGHGTLIAGNTFASAAQTQCIAVPSNNIRGLTVVGNYFATAAGGAAAALAFAATTGHEGVILGGNHYINCAEVTGTNPVGLLKLSNASELRYYGTQKNALDIWAREGAASQVIIGATGPGNEAGIRMGTGVNWYRNGSTQVTARCDVPVTVPTYTTATKPAAGNVPAGTVIFVSDGGAGAVFQGSTGAAWVNLG